MLVAKKIQPKNDRQARYVDLLQKKKPPIVIASGSAGSGKSLLATWVGAEKLSTGAVKRIIITRPTVGVEDEQLGFMPGTLEQKMEPWMRPVFDAFLKVYKPDEVTRMMRDKTIEICPFAFMRGRTFENSWILCDEAQNCTAKQMLMILTRIGEGSKMVITGDPTQHDRIAGGNGLQDLLWRVNEVGIDQDMIGLVEFAKEDVERHYVIPHILRLYN